MNASHKQKITVKLKSEVCKNSRHHLVIKSVNETGKICENRITIKTRPAIWQHTYHPVILPVSIYSALYKENLAALKIAAFLQAIKSNIQGKVTILTAAAAHLQTISLNYAENCEIALRVCHQDTAALITRFTSGFHGYELVDWNDFVNGSKYYTSCRAKIYHRAKTDRDFQLQLNVDAEKTYNAVRSKLYPNADLYLHKAKLDLLEQCVYLLIAANEGYRFEFYPGKRNGCAEYINSQLLDRAHQLLRINVTISSPKKNRV